MRTQEQKIQQKRKKEQTVVKEMISLYCRKNHGSHSGCLCPECLELSDYAQKRSENVLLWRKRPSVPIVRFTAISLR